MRKSIEKESLILNKNNKAPQPELEGYGVTNLARWRIYPFAIYMSFIGVEACLRYLTKNEFLLISAQEFTLLYPLKVLVVSFLLLLWWRKYTEIKARDILNLRNSLLSLLVGMGVFVLWINMDWLLPGQEAPVGFNPEVFQTGIQRNLIVLVRIAGAALVVPVMEELFWRSFMLRYIINTNFSKVPIGQFTWGSLLICALLFGLEHHFILAGIMAGAFYALLLYKTKSIAQCILAHAVTNFALGIYVLQTGRWYFW